MFTLYSIIVIGLRSYCPKHLVAPPLWLLTMSEEINDLEYEYLDDILQDIDGIGNTTAARVITLKDCFSDFNDLSVRELTNVKGFDKDKAEKLIDKFEDIDFDKGIETLYTEKILKDFLDSQYEKVRNITLDNLDINVLLVKALGFTTAEEAIEFYVYQRITRSSVTAWGQKSVEDICFVSGAEKVPSSENVKVSGKRFDMKKKKDSDTYYIQLKSGPNTMNVGMVNSLNEMIEKIEEKHEDGIGMLGMTYGKENQVSSQIRDNLNNFDEKALIGKEFWEFLTDDEEYYSNLIGLIDSLSNDYEERYEHSYLELVEEQIDQLEREWEESYGATGRKGLDNFIEEYTG